MTHEGPAFAGPKAVQESEDLPRKQDTGNWGE